MILLNLLNRVPRDRNLWCIRGKDYSASEIAGWLRFARASLRELHGRRVAVLAERDVDLVSSLLVLDGLAEEITVLPFSAAPSTRAALVADAGCEICLIPDSQTELGGLDMAAMPRSIEFETWHVPLDADGQSDVPVADVETRWLLPTSGTTGRPKLVSHSLDSLSRSVKSDLSRGSEFSWGSLYGLGSFAGLQVFLQSWFAGSRFIFTPTDSSLPDRIEALRAAGCNSLSATPTMWRMVLMSGDSLRIALDRITLGGEICDQTILDSLRERFPDAKIVHIYASTEAGVGFAVRDGKEGFPVELLDQPPPGIEIRVDDQDHLLLKPERIDQRFANPCERLLDGGGFIDTGDIVERVGRRFLFKGRASGVINVGGLKVHPQVVESTLLRHPDVKFAKVEAQKNPFTGAVVKAETVLASSSRILNDEAPRVLTLYCREQLQPHEVPATISVVDSIDVSATGKLIR